MDEIWKPVRNWEGLYEISSQGRLASLKNGERRILSIKNGKGWYLSINLRCPKSLGFRSESVKIHKLVYESFVGPVPTGFQIHHIDGDRQNNNISNLVAITPAEHVRITCEENPSCYLPMIKRNVLRPVEQYDLEGNYITEYMNCRHAAEATGICARNITQVAYRTPYKEGKYRKQAGGFIWKLKNEVKSA